MAEFDETTPEQGGPPITPEPSQLMGELGNAIPLEVRQAEAGKVNQKYNEWRQPRRVHELQWFINAAYRKGKHTTEALTTLNSVSDLSKLDRRKKNIANKLWAKGRARYAKFVRTRPKAIVVPFTHERQDRLDARMTERALDYLYEKDNQEQKYADAILWAGDTGKSYWWIHWNEQAPATIQQVDPLTNQKSLHDVEAGDIETEVDSAFGILVPDLRRVHIKDQPEIMRVSVLAIEDAQKIVEAEDPALLEHIKADSPLGSPFEFERQIAHLSGSEAGSLAGMTADTKGESKGVIVKEHYTKPCAKYPQGRMVVVMNNIAVKIQEELPHGFADMDNPYPCVEFMDMPQVGQFYVTTFIEQLIPLQRGYNMIRDKLETQIRMNVHPKWMVARQARIAKGSLTNADSEVVEWNYIPGMPEPHPVQMQSVVADAWRFTTLLEKEFDDISQVFPAFEGKTGSSKSGFQTNLLQEASDNVHSPDARGFELAIRDFALKARRMMKKGYTVPRLLSFAGRSSIPEVFEFSSENIDEHAAIRVQIGSGLSQFKATRVQQLLEFHEKGLLGDPNDPEVKRRVLSLVDLGGIEEFQEKAARDEDMARMENIDMLAGMPIPNPQFYEDHLVHYSVHTDELKSPANKMMDDDLRRSMIGHVLLHMKYINPMSAYNLAIETGLEELINVGLLAPPPAPSPEEQVTSPGESDATPTQQGV